MFFDGQMGYSGEYSSPYYYCFYCPSQPDLTPQLISPQGFIREPSPETKGPQEFKCRSCHKFFKTKATAESHYKNIHEKPVRISCGKCGQVFSNKYILKKHVLKNHPPKPEIS